MTAAEGQSPCPVPEATTAQACCASRPAPLNTGEKLVTKRRHHGRAWKAASSPAIRAAASRAAITYGYDETQAACVSFIPLVKSTTSSKQGLSGRHEPSPSALPHRLTSAGIVKHLTARGDIQESPYEPYHHLNQVDPCNALEFRAGRADAVGRFCNCTRSHPA